MFRRNKNLNESFFEDGYVFLYPDVKNLKISPLNHYLKYGVAEGRSNGNNPPCDKFFAEGYCLMYPDVDPTSAWRHYVLVGFKEGRSNGLNPPENFFYSDGYLYLYPDVKDSQMNPWRHYVTIGHREGRSNGLVPLKDKFWSDGYLILYPEVKNMGLIPWKHYVEFGIYEGRSNGLKPPKNFFFAEGYLALYPDVKLKKIDPWKHYVDFGYAEGRGNGVNPPKDKFYEKGYLVLYPDVAKSGVKAWNHYAKKGIFEGRSNGLNPPNDKFFAEGYLALYPDVRKVRMNPWIHYVEYGIAEGRNNGFTPNDDLFYKEGYLVLYPDVSRQSLDPWEHYAKYGIKEGRNNGINPPSDFFYKDGYLTLYPELRTESIDPWRHYVCVGLKEGRSNGLVPPEDKFFAEGYLALYPDVKDVGMDPWRHYVRYGKAEGRSNGIYPPSDKFYEKGYLYLYPDVKKFKKGSWFHYALHGINEGRSNGLFCSPDVFNNQEYNFLYPDIVKKKVNAFKHYIECGIKENRPHKVVQRLAREIQDQNSCKGRILLISHELSLTGAPLSLVSIAKMFKESGYYVEIWTFPKVEYSLKDLDIDVFLIPRLCYNFQNLGDILRNFDLVVCNTITTADYVNFMIQNDINHMWIIREGRGLFDWLDKNNYDHNILIADNENIVVVSDYVKDIIYEKIGVDIKVLRNFIQDEYDFITKNFKKRYDDAYHFTICGTLEKRKGIDICISAFLLLNINLKSKWVLHIVGELSDLTKNYWEPLKSICANYDNIIFHNKLEGDRKWDIFYNTDVFIVPSMDEACSRVVLESSMLGIPSIVSSNVGAKYLLEGVEGFVCDPLTPYQLGLCVTNCINMSKSQLYRIGKKIRCNFVNTSTLEIYKCNFAKLISINSKIKYSPRNSTIDYLLPSVLQYKQLRTIINNIDISNCFNNYPVSTYHNVDDEVVNVIIPIFNGIEHLEILLPSLFANTDIPHLFILVDDCSDSVTKEWLEANCNHRNDVLIIENEVNLGFSASINKAQSLYSNRNFVILNSDTQVPKGWLQRLIKPILSDSNVATVTPFSSCATICSFPNFSSDSVNKQFLDLYGLDNIDDACRNFGGEIFYEIPVGHGFCMAISAKVWNEIGPLNLHLYGRGYGEEVDWCQRAYMSGYKNVMVTNLYVAHYHKGSFDEKTKKENLKSSALIHKHLFPSLNNQLTNYIKLYPIKDVVFSILIQLVSSIPKNLKYIPNAFIALDDLSSTISVIVRFNFWQIVFQNNRVFNFYKYFDTFLSKNNIYFSDNLFVKGMFVANKVNISNKPLFCIIPALAKSGCPAGSGYVRTVLPWSNSWVIDSYDLKISLDIRNRLPSTLSCKKGSICLLQREVAGVSERDVVDFCTEWRANDGIVIYDLDDDFFTVNELAEKARITIQDATDRLSKVVSVINNSDLVIASTDLLRNKIYANVKQCPKVIVIRNFVDLRLWNCVSNCRNSTFSSNIVRIGYMGTSSHLDDMFMIKDAVDKIVAEFGDKVEFEVVGVGNDDEIPWGHSIKPPFVSYPNFVKWLKSSVSWDIGLIPLRDTKFNQGKSDLKFLEYACLGVPVIVSDMPVFTSISRHNENCLLVKNTTTDWYEALKSLILDSEKRSFLSNNAYKLVSQLYSIQNNSGLYMSVIDEFGAKYPSNPVS